MCALLGLYAIKRRTRFFASQTDWSAAPWSASGPAAMTNAPTVGWKNQSYQDQSAVRTWVVTVHALNIHFTTLQCSLKDPNFLAHLGLCMLNPYASLTIHLSVCHWTKIDQKIIIIYILITIVARDTSELTLKVKVIGQRPVWPGQKKSF